MAHVAVARIMCWYVSASGHRGSTSTEPLCLLALRPLLASKALGGTLSEGVHD